MFKIGHEYFDYDSNESEMHGTKSGIKSKGVDLGIRHQKIVGDTSLGL